MVREPGKTLIVIMSSMGLKRFQLSAISFKARIQHVVWTVLVLVRVCDFEMEGSQHAGSQHMHVL